MTEVDKILQEIMQEFLNENESELVIYNGDIGRTMQNHINDEKGRITAKAMRFTIEKMMEKNNVN